MPYLHYVGDEKMGDGRVFHIMVMDLLGKSLAELLSKCNGKLDLKTVCQIAK